MASYFDPRDGKTHCGRCDSASWSSIGRCEDCNAECCDDCATAVETTWPHPNELLCSQCSLQRALEAAGEEVEEVPADPGIAAYKLVPPAQGNLFQEQATRKPMRVELPNKPTSDRQAS